MLERHPTTRTERDLRLVLTALDQTVKAFAEFPLKMQEKLVRVGWYERYACACACAYATSPPLHIYSTLLHPFECPPL